jgi:hypothetical protein
MKKIFFFAVATFFTIISYNCSSPSGTKNNDCDRCNSDPKKNGYIINENTAIEIAQAIWLPIYGEEINNERPFHAILKNDSIWVVEGTQNADNGGTAYIEILKKDCRVLKVTHGK